MGWLLRGRAGRNRDLDSLRAEANALFDSGRFPAAQALYERILAQGDDPRVSVNLGYCLLATGDVARAEPRFRAALGDPQAAPNARVGLGDLAAGYGDHADAVAHYREAVALAPDLAAAHNNLALSLTALGEFEEAYREAEWRYAMPDTRALLPHRVELPRWRGESLAGRRLLVHWEQGFGDIVQHLRFLPLLRARGASFVFDCPPPLVPLARCVVAPGELRTARSEGVDVSGFDLTVPLLSLPHILDTTWETLPREPYLFGDPARTQALRAAWQVPGKQLVGVTWRSSTFDPSRNLAPADLLATLAAIGARAVALQVGLSGEERALLAAHGAVNGLAAAADFGETAAAVAALDLVVTVDTVIAHVAGAMGRPAWIMLNEPAAVRWMTRREDSPWYPSVRLVRRPREASAASVLARLRAALAA